MGRSKIRSIDLPGVGVVRLLHGIVAHSTTLLRAHEKDERNVRNDFSSLPGSRFLHFIPMRLVFHVRNKYPRVGVSVRGGVEGEKQLRRELPESMSAVVVRRESVKDLSPNFAKFGDISESLGNIEDVLK